MNLFGGISAGLMTMLLLLMIMPSSSNGIKITVTADEDIFTEYILDNLLSNKMSNSTTIKVKGTNKVEDLKQKIIGKMTEKFKIEYGSDLKRLTLKYGQNDDYDILNDRKTINDYPIKEDDTVLLSIDEFKIVVPYKHYRIHYNVWLKREETVAILKKKIRNEINGWITSDDQILKVDRNGDGGTMTVLEDEKTMTNYGIGEGSTVLLITHFEIVVKYKKDNEWKTVTVWMTGSNKVYELRKNILERIKCVFPEIEDIAINDCENSNYNEELNTDYSTKTLKNCGIGEGTTIYLVSGWVVDAKKKNIKHRVELM